MAEDHANARLFAEGIADLPSIDLDPATVRTNIVFFRLTDDAPMDAPALADAVMATGVRIGSFDARTLRAVTHLDVDRAGVERAVSAIRAVLV
jgi:threonine aldolase